MKTIRQIADELGVSKQAVFKKMKREPLSTRLRGLTATVDGRLMVSVDGENLVKSAFLPQGPSTDRQPVDDLVDGLVDGENPVKSTFLPQGPSTDRQPIDGLVDGLVDAPSTSVDGLIAVLQATIDTLKEQLEVKDRQIEQQGQTITRLTDALAAAQQTAAAAQALHAGTIKQKLMEDEDGLEQKCSLEPPMSWWSRFFGGTKIWKK